MNGWDYPNQIYRFGYSEGLQVNIDVYGGEKVDVNEEGFLQLLKAIRIIDPTIDFTNTFEGYLPEVLLSFERPMTNGDSYIIHDGISTACMSSKHGVLAWSGNTSIENTGQSSFSEISLRAIKYYTPDADESTLLYNLAVEAFQQRWYRWPTNSDISGTGETVASSVAYAVTIIDAVNRGIPVSDPYGTYVSMVSGRFIPLESGTVPTVILTPDAFYRLSNELISPIITAWTR